MTGSVDIDQLQVEIDRFKEENKKLRTSNRHWMRIAGTDHLTGLPNKVFFTTALLPPLITQANVDSSSFVCIMVAPDRLGDINQKYGREGGDQIVVGLAKYLKDNLESDEKLVHIDGANFVIVVPDCDQSGAKRRTRQFRARVVSRHFECGNNVISLTLSMGVVLRALGPQGAATKIKEVSEDLLRRMGLALDEAKRHGGDKVVEDTESQEV